MLSFEDAFDEGGTPTLVEHERATFDDLDTEAPEPVAVPESSTSAAARVLELAAGTADQLVADARTEAESLVTTARTEADAILESSRTEAYRASAELSRRTEEQTAQLDRERATALAALVDEKTDLESRIATLRQMQSDHRDQMRHHLTEQLSLLDATVFEPPAVAG